jgi:uncharacterized membrane protein YcaP (DUF421 family)
MTSKVTPFDLQRMLFGDAPPGFLLEVFFRGLGLYLFMLLVVRLLGKRMAGKLTVMEMVLMITLGGSIAVAMQVPEGGVLMGFVVLTCAFSFERGIAWLTVRSKRFETISQGRGIILVKDGVLQIRCLEENNITRQQIFSALRAKEISQLGKIERLYLEASGHFSVYKASEENPGLSISPPDDQMMTDRQKKAAGLVCCCHCGLTVEKTGIQVCTACKHNEWVEAVF